jgi:diguanylate cyclase (GGDEF)-like protein
VSSRSHEILSLSKRHPNRALYFVILGGVLWGIGTIGPMVAFWAYPVVIATLVVSDRRQARWLIGIGAALFGLAAVAWMTTETAARFAMTFGLTWYFGDLVASLLTEQETRLTNLATVDPLTGAFNRRHMSAQLPHAIEQQKRGLGEVSVIAVDIDDFKKINDEHGHAVGDTILRGVVGVLQRRTRKVDSVFRTGGEEFLVLARNLAPAQAGVIAESLRAQIEASDLLDGEIVTVSGEARVPPHCSQPPPSSPCSRRSRPGQCSRPASC